MPKPIDHRRAVKLLKWVVKIHGPLHIYVPPLGGMCKYVHNGAPSCLIGLALYRAGWTVEELEALDLAHLPSVRFLHDTHPHRITEKGAKVLSAAQLLQDNGDFWGNAVAHAETVSNFYDHAIRS